MAKIISIEKLLKMPLDIPPYQRPYKWSIRNIEDLLRDINNAIIDRKKYGENFKYRIGTIILHKKEDSLFDIVDGQQRIISLVLLQYYLDANMDCSILHKDFSNKVTQANIHRNYHYICEWFSLKSDKNKHEFIEALANVLEVVLICVERVAEAFQLFDSQNTRGKALDPHDLLKAYHLREMKMYPYEMEHAVKKWENKDSYQIRDLFDLYLFPIWNWSRRMKSKPFTAKEIDTYKGVSEGSAYPYARRASRAMPYFQITEPFVAGNDFFEMVEHYIYLLSDIKTEIFNNPQFADIREILCNGRDVTSPGEMDAVKYGSAGFGYTKNLFFCALLHYYDKFHNFDEMAVKKLFTWAFMLRADMKNLGFDSVNKYAIGDENARYTNNTAIFSIISSSRSHNEIASLPIKVKRENDVATSSKWHILYEKLKKINGLGGVI